MRSFFSKLLTSGAGAEEPRKPCDFSVRLANAKDLRACLSLEKSLSPTRGDAEERGFLLPGSQIGDYEEYLTRGVFLVAEHGGSFCGYLTALPSSHPRIQRFAGDQGFALNEVDLWTLPELYWIGKLAVQPSKQRSGAARAMYERLFSLKPDGRFVTAAMIAPLENRASCAVHEALGFSRIGTYTSVRPPSKEKMVCAIYLK